ncbi:Uncharacterised protein [Mycobacterium tuberculosis]|uniref:Uncharacterized protein n=1 Tax=Mycobacterium tuberculosis TaxID=1773 RepID=A0A654ZYY4_MYCTX|nr:Uncharacterised protein [Mycobacterium tuberculosis]CKS96912.1 Uncharacterised protein [Mycobacterium tuberculosis]CNZ79536.1 Uncharacterised protein [Mycobacterium tuberculosis]COW79734.1 Uncharacterised protein [Mycobacterium tuberculosis]SGO99098.1 Uncharacterised protein [Mycobacterium tuberculosis]
MALSTTSTLISTCGNVRIADARSDNDEPVCTMRVINRSPVTMPSPVEPSAGMTMWPDCSPPRL